MTRLLFVLLFTLSAQAVPTLINGTAAMVGTKLVTVRDAYFYHSLEHFQKTGKVLFAIKKGTVLKRVVDKIIFEEMVEGEIKSFGFERKTGKEARADLAEMKRKHGAKRLRTLLKHFGKGEKAVIAQLSRSLRVDGFVKKKVETLTPIITQAEVERYFGQHKKRFGGKDLAAARGDIEVQLKKESVSKGLKEWIRFLKGKYQVTSHVDG